jgi:peptidase M28-like protein/PDZ domain-containing protein/PA domain-containing protein
MPFHRFAGPQRRLTALFTQHSLLSSAMNSRLLRASRLPRSLCRKLISVAGLIFLFCAPAVLAAQSGTQHYLDDVKALTAPQMEGRGDGTKGLTRAAEMLERRYRQLALEPAGVKGYFQPFTVITGARLKKDNYVHTQSGPEKASLKLGQDFVPFSFSASGTVTAPVVFAGYGATAPEFGYDDYANIDAKEKIVLVLRYEPPAFAKGRAGLTQHSDLITKAINARNHGAKAVVIVNGKLPEGAEDLLTRFGSVSGPVDSGVILLQVRNAVSDSWLQAAGKSLAQLQSQINDSSKPVSFALPPSLRLSIAVDVEHTKATVNNVLAYLPGQTDEYIILGAHYDHLGKGNFDSLAPSQIGQIHPGADDNASGTAGLLDLARRLAPMRGKLHRGILFASFAGEELGLLGSAEWVKEPTLPLEKATAMLNMDMIGRIKDDKVYVGGVGTGSTFQNMLAEAQTKSGLKIEASPGGYSSSDHTSFVAKRIPVLFFFSGLHSDYHKPSDTWEKINADAALRLLDLVENVSQQLATASARPAFITVAEDRPAASGSGGGGYGAYFGSIPDFGQVENGVRFSDVRPGSPAAKAGLKAGDVLVQFGDLPIKNLYDFTDALRRSKVGDLVEVKVLRDGQPVTASVKLEQRK